MKLSWAERMADIEKHADTYQKMNIIAGNRVGFDIKQKYLDRLAELSANGYLTSKEYDARVDWINNALTSNQLEEAFKDLPSSYHVQQFRKQEKKKPGPYAIVQQWWFCVPFLALEMFCTIADFTRHHTGVGILCLFGVMIWAFFLGRSIRK
jgi:hypothetical protein